MRYCHDPDGTRLPIKLDTTTNGEFAPIPLEPVHRYARQLALETATTNAKRLGLSRREFLVSACGAATTLLAMNAAYAADNRRSGAYEIANDAGTDAGAAKAALHSDDFVFDVQGHFVNPTGAWTKALPPDARPLRFATDRASCGSSSAPGLASMRCLDSNAFVKDVFLDSDTDLMVLSFVPSTRKGEPLTIEEAAATARIVEKLRGTHRLFIHGRVNPNQAGDLEGMDMLAERYKIAAWKTYTQWGPDGTGFFLDDDVGIAFIEKARKLGIKNIAVHKGLPFGPQSYEHSTAVDVGRVAKRFPDVNFLIYHSGFVAEKPERAYDASRSDGIDALCTSLRSNGINPGSNVYAELGSTWRFVMRDPDSAAHSLGKLFQFVGEDNVLWGTDSIWYGSPQDQIQAFRTFQIAPELRAKHGYSEITPTVRAKIFGLNAARVYSISADEVKKHTRADPIAQERFAYSEHPEPHYLTHGPKTRREFLNLLSWNGGSRA